MMSNGKTIKIYETIKNDMQEQGRLIRYLGGRTPQEILLLSGKAMGYSAKLRGVESDERTRRAFGLYLAAWDLRKSRPHSADVLATIAEQRELIENTKHGVIATIERDFDYITALRDREGMSYVQISEVLGKLRRYNGHAPHKDTIRKTIKRLEAARIKGV